MPKHDPFSPKAVANRIKAKGLQRLRWYCQMCEKQCRDENGFKCHCVSEAHQRQMAIFAENPERYLEQFSNEFEGEFLAILSRRYGTKRVLANQVYQEIVADRQHLHMNATRWDTLADFVKHLGRAGKCKVQDSERGWMVEWIDVSPAALARKAAILKKERQDMDDEQREQKLLREQIARAKGMEQQQPQRREATGLIRDTSGQPIKLSLKPAASKEASGASSSPSLLVKPFRASLQPKASLKQTNPFRKAAKAAAASKPASTAPPADKEALRRRDRSRSPDSNRRQRSRSPRPRY
ncbi:hypothetical protein GGF46_004378 [Coemansia sp. RSA 552]|nr:hypothetical protein GGF46_004378 [Coemansia sp. RSA 552]